MNFLASRHHVDVVYMDGSGQPPSPELSGFLCPTALPAWRRRPASRTARAALSCLGRAVYRAAAAKLTRQRYDYIICDYGLSAVYALLLSSRFETPFVCSSHNIEFRANLTKAQSAIRAGCRLRSTCMRPRSSR